MTRLIAVFALLALPVLGQQFSHRSNPPRPGDGAGGITAVYSAGPPANCPGTGCQVLGTEGVQSTTIEITGTWTATLAFVGSNDNFATTVALAAYPMSAGVPGAAVTTTTANGVWVIPTLGMRLTGVTCTAFTANTSMAIRINGSPVGFTSERSPTETAKGTQSTTFVGVQEAKDTGRTFVVLGADGVTPAIAETVITFAKNVGGTVTGAQTTYTITSGKTLRIQSVCASFTAGATANRVRVALRLNTGGACIAGSALLLPAVELAPNYGTATAAEGGMAGCVAIPDGLDITGDGTKAICLSEAAVAAAGTLTTNVVAFEY